MSAPKTPGASADTDTVVDCSWDTASTVLELNSIQLTHLAEESVVEFEDMCDFSKSQSDSNAS